MHYAFVASRGFESDMVAYKIHHGPGETSSDVFFLWAVVSHLHLLAALLEGTWGCTAPASDLARIRFGLTSPATSTTCQ